MYKPLLYLLLLLTSFSRLMAQDYLGEDLPFFQKKAQLYQAWLNAQGMGDALKVDQVRLQKNDMELELFLTLRTSDPDTAAGMWQSLDRAFNAGNPGKNFGEVLFHTFVRMMEISPIQGNIQIYIPKKDGFGYDPCFYIWFWEEDGTVVEEKRINNCKAQPLEIVVKSPKVKLVGGDVQATYQGKEDAREVFEQLLKYARGRYEKKNCYERDPRVEEIEMTDYRLTFSVSDLCQEVLTDENASPWCNFLEDLFDIPCNDMRRERLEFTFNYIPAGEGYLLNGQLTGKFGSGVYRPRKSAYMDMEPDFEVDYLKPYVKNFQNALRAYLEKR